MSFSDIQPTSSNMVEPPREKEIESNAKRQYNCSPLTIEEPQLDTFEAVVHGKKKVTKVSKRRKISPEDERTLQILAEKFRTDENGASCQVHHCKSKHLKSTKPSNLKRHIEQVHPEEHSNLFPHEVNVKKQTELEVYNTLQDAIELVTVNGYPFSMLDASGMRGFTHARLKPFRLQGESLTINRQDIVKKVAEMSEIIRNRIKAEVNGKTISVMFDMCTIATLATFGVNVNYMDEYGNVVSRSLGIIKIEKRHTAVNLADILFDLLAKFEIPLSKVFSITADTAKNATNTSDVLNTIMANCGENSTDKNPEQIITDNFSDDDDFDSGIDIQNEMELQKLIENADRHTLLAEETAHKFRTKLRLN